MGVTDGEHKFVISAKGNIGSTYPHHPQHTPD